MTVHASSTPRGSPAGRLSSDKPVRGSLVFWLRFLGILAFFLILARLPKAQELPPSRIDLGWLGFCMLLTILQLLIEALVWQSLLSAQRIRHPYPKTLLVYLASQYLGLVTPGHVGEFLAAGYISTETGLTIGYALSGIVMKKILSWLTIVGFGIWGAPLLAQLPFVRDVKQVIWMTALVPVILAVGIGLWVVFLRRLARKWERLSPWKIDMTEFWFGLRQLVSPRLIVPLALAAGGFSLLFLQLDAVLRALGITLPFVTMARIMALSRMAARLAPISIVGFGSKDAMLIALLNQQGLGVPLAVTVALLLLLCSYLVTLVLSGLAWWVKPLVVRRPLPGRA